MIVIHHHNGMVTNFDARPELNGHRVADALFLIARENPADVVAWCDESCRGKFDEDAVRLMFRHHKMMISFRPGRNYFPESIGYAEESSFININKFVNFPTWQMSGLAGAVGCCVLNAVSGQINTRGSLSYFLCSVAKLAMPLGMFSYSTPSILRDAPEDNARASTSELLRFVAHHYKKRWVLSVFLNMVMHDRKFPVAALIGALFQRRRKINPARLDEIIVDVSRPADKSIDVLIPTIGRKEFLLDFLNDLSRQTLRPRKVIVIEQNPGGESELEFLQQQWPFQIIHLFTQQPGACNARNLGLEKVASSWVFLADDDIRIGPDFLEEAMSQAKSTGAQVLNFSCLQKGQQPEFSRIHQTSIFGAGCSIISRESLGGSRFNLSYEFGFLEDLEFARQLLNKGYDTVYFPQPSILHLKAPVGGFRTKPVLPWHDDPVQPKPSPTVMRYRLDHHTREQLLGYRTTLMFKFYRHQPVKNPLNYYRDFTRRWERSLHYANILKERGG